MRDGVTLTNIGVMFDEEVTTRSEWVGKGADGFPVLEGKVTDVIGTSLIIRCVPRKRGALGLSASQCAAVMGSGF